MPVQKGMLQMQQPAKYIPQNLELPLVFVWQTEVSQVALIIKLNIRSDLEPFLLLIIVVIMRMIK